MDTPLALGRFGEIERAAGNDAEATTSTTSMSSISCSGATGTERLFDDRRLRSAIHVPDGILEVEDFNFHADEGER